MNAIKKILSVTDTRQYEEAGDRYIPIPGSGIAHDCYRCGKVHEVHYEVELDNGERVIAGSTCAKGESVEIQARFKSAGSLVKTLARNKAMLAGYEKKNVAYLEARAKVEAMPVPIIEIRGDKLVCGNVEVWTRTANMADPRDREERGECVRNGWKHKRMSEIFGEHPHLIATDWLKRKIEQQEKRLAEICNGG